jgi:hypothetical protein
MVAAIDIPYLLLKHPVKSISPQWSLVYLARSHSIYDHQGVHSALGSEQVVFYSQVSILTTSLSSRALLFGSPGVPRSVEGHSLKSGWHASTS